MKINTETLRKALDFLSMGVTKSLDKYETELIEFETSNGRLKGYTCDDVNKLGMRICDTDETLNVTLKFDMLYNLVKACKDDEIEIVAAKNFTTFKSKTISCKLSTFTHSITKPEFPKYTDSADGSVIRENLPIIKAMLRLDHVEPCYRGVYFSDYIMASDTDNVAIINEKLFNNILLPYHSVQILSTFDKFDYIVGSRKICAFCDGKIVDIALIDKTKYQYEDILALFSISNKNKISIDKSIFSNALSTASLFGIDKVDLVFDSTGMRIEIPTEDFKYTLSETPCIDRKYTLPMDRIKKFLIVGDTLTIGYDLEDLVLIENDKIKTLIGVPKNEK